jgi:hypothetical protein
MSPERDDTPGVRSAIGADLRAVGVARAAAMVGVVVWLVYEWGPGNETVTPWILANVLRTTEGWGSVAATVTVAFGFTAAQQVLSGVTALYGFSVFDRTAQAVWRSLQGRGASLRWSQLSPVGRVAVAFGLGTTAVALGEIVLSGKPGLRRHLPAVLGSAMVAAVAVAVIGGVVAGLTLAGRQSDRTRALVETFLDVASSPLLWLTLAGLVLAWQVRASRATT